MKITIGQLKRSIVESLDDTWVGPLLPSFTASSDELNRIISAMNPDTISDKDYVDDETGEIVLERGQRADACRLHPAYVERQKRKKEKDDEEYKTQLSQWELEDREQELENDNRFIKAEHDYEKLINDFIENYDVEELTHEQVSDATEAIFWQYPEWKSIAKILKKSRISIKAHVADLLADKIH